MPRSTTKCSAYNCGKGIKGRVRCLNGKFKLMMDEYTTVHGMEKYAEGSPFCTNCRSRVLNYFQYRSNVNADQDQFSIENEDRTRMEVQEEYSEMQVDDISNDQDFNNMQDINIQHSSQPQQKPLKPQRNENEESPDLIREIEKLHCRMLVVERQLGIDTTLADNLDLGIEASVQLLKNRASVIENVAESALFSSQIPEAAAVYSDSSSSQIVLNSECVEFNLSSTKPKPCAKQYVCFPARTIPHTERFCIVCRSSRNRAAIPMKAIVDLFITKQVLINPKSRSCCHHLKKGNKFNHEAKEILIERAIEKSTLRIQSDDLWEILVALSDAAGCRKGILEFNEETPEERYDMFLGVTKKVFQQLQNSISPHMKNTDNRKVSTALAILLAKLRLGLSQRVIGFLFGCYSQSTVSTIIHRVVKLLSTHVVPQFIGWNHLSREEALCHQKNRLSTNFFALDEDALVIIADGTYIPIQKPHSHEFQFKSYCLHKHKNLLKMMMVILESGYILDASGPWLSYSKNNDSGILKATLISQQPIETVLKPEDLFILDRGFRDVMSWLQNNNNYNSVCPKFLSRGQKQFTSLEANENRCITKVRFRVEIVNGRISNRWRMFAKPVENLYIPILGDLYRICCALHNLDFKPIESDVGWQDQIVEACFEERSLSDTLLAELTNEGLDKKRKCWNQITKSDATDFPTLTKEDFLRIDHGTYQISNAEEYIRRSDFFCHSTKAILRAKVKSRFHSGKVHSCYVEYEPNGKSDKSILRRACTCITGLRMFGACSHVVALIYHFGYGRHNLQLRQTTDFLRFVYDAADIISAHNREHDEPCDSQAETEPEDLTQSLDEPDFIRFGLPNVYNSCFINATLQMLFCVPEVKANLPFCKELKTYYDGVFTRPLSIITAKVAKVLMANLLKKYMDKNQHDAHEFLMDILNVRGLMGLRGLFVQCTEIVRGCSCGEVVRSTSEEIGFFALPNISLNEISFSVANHEEHGKCTCGLPRSLSSQKIVKFPKYALICFKICQHGTKIRNTQLEPSFMLKSDGMCAAYSIVAAVTHSGEGMENGHYKAYLFGDKTICYNDKEKSESNVDGDIYMSLYRLL